MQDSDGRSRIRAVELPPSAHTRPRSLRSPRATPAPSPGIDVEVVGRGALTAAVAADGLEVARPERDIGIDLLIYTVTPWRVVPMQLKAASRDSFGIDAKYARVPGIVMVCAWNLLNGLKIEFYALGYPQALAIAEQLGWTQTSSWLTGGRYDNTRPGPRVKSALAEYRVLPGGWPRALGFAAGDEADAKR